MIPKEYIGKTRITKWKSPKGKREYTVICNYPDEEYVNIIEERVKAFYINRITPYLQGYTSKQQEIIIPVIARCYELKDHGYDFDEIESIILKEWTEKGLIEIPNDKGE